MRQRPPEVGTPNAPRTPARSVSVASSPTEIPTWSASTRRRCTPPPGPRRPPRRPGRARARARCRRTHRARSRPRRPPGRRPAAERASWIALGDGRAGRAGRGTPRTCSRRRPAAPARCRCWRSPSPAGCAARGSAARAGTPGCRRRPWTPRPAARAAVRSSAGPDGDEPGVRAAVEQRHPEPLAGADGDVGAPLARRGGQRVSASRSQAAITMAPCGVGLRRRSRGARRCRPAGRWRPGSGSTTANGVGLAERLAQRTVGADHLEAQRGGPGAHHARGLRQGVGVDQQHRARSWLIRRARVIASATAVASSSRLAPAVGSPVRSETMVWKLSSASSRPWLISGW